MLAKRLTEIVVPVALALFAGMSQAAPVTIVELTTNGGFETGNFSGWTQFVQTGTQTISTVNPSSGANSANLAVTTGDTLMKQANVGIGLVNPGDVVTISFDYRGSVTPGGVIFAEFFSELTGGGVSAAEILTGGPLFPNPDPNVWTTYSGTAIAGPDVSGGVTLQLKAGAGAGSANIFFDNASMTIEVAAVPVPAAVWLFGSGLVGLVGVARRKKAA